MKQWRRLKGIIFKRRAIAHVGLISRPFGLETIMFDLTLGVEIKNKQIEGYQFHRQVPMLDYNVDFYCHKLMLVIEIEVSNNWA